MTAEALAERFGVTARTIFRDLATLREARLPLLSSPGRGGGYALDRSYVLPPVNFTAREAAVLLAAGRWLVEGRLLPLTETLGSALDKVRAALPAAAAVELERALASLAFVGVPARPAPAEVRSAVEEAWLGRRALAIRYRGARGVTERVVRVETVVMERGETLLNCLDVRKGETRQFRLHQIEAAFLVAPGAVG